MTSQASLGREHYPSVSIGCCFYNREPNYQLVVESIEAIAECYPGGVHAYIYFSDQVDVASQLSRLIVRHPSTFTFACGPNRVDEPKYRLPLRSDTEFVLTLDDDCTFAPETLTILVDAYNELQRIDPRLNRLSPVGWFGTELVSGRLLLPIEGRYDLAKGELRRVDYIGSCGALFRRELLEDPRMERLNWPKAIGAASDLWLSFLISAKYRTPAYITRLSKVDLPEWGHALWDDINNRTFSAAVRSLVRRGWRAPDGPFVSRLTRGPLAARVGGDNAC